METVKLSHQIQSLQEWIADFLEEGRSGYALIKDYQNLGCPSQAIILQRLDEIIVILKSNPQRKEIIKGLKSRFSLHGMVKQLCGKFESDKQNESHLLTRLVVISMGLAGLLNGTEEKGLLSPAMVDMKPYIVTRLPLLPTATLSVLKDIKIYPNIILLVSEGMNDLIENALSWEHPPRDRECIVFQKISELLFNLLHFDEFASVWASSEQTVDEICNILLEGLKLYAENKKVYPVLFHLFCIFARDRHVSSEQLLELTEKMVNYFGFDMDQVIAKESRASLGNESHYVSRIISRCAIYLATIRDAFVLIRVARLTIYADEDNSEILMRGVWNQLPHGKDTFRNQIRAKSFALSVNNLDPKIKMRWYSSDTRDLIQELGSGGHDKYTVSYMLSALITLCKFPKYRSIFLENQNFFDMVHKIVESYTNAEDVLAWQVLSLIWVLLEDPVFHAYLLGGMEAFNLPKVPLDAPNLVRILPVVEKLMQSTTSIAMKQSCLFLFSAVTTVPTQSVLSVGDIIRQRSSVAKHYIPNTETSSGDYFLLLLMNTLKLGVKQRKDFIDVTQFAAIALWCRSRHSCYVSKMLIGCPTLPALLLQSIQSTDGNFIQAIAGSISGLCAQHEENRRRFGEIEGFALQLTSFLLQYKDNEAIAISLCEAIGALSLLEENAIAFGKVELLFDLLIEILALYEKNPKVCSAVHALGGLSSCSNNAMLISKLPKFCQNLGEALETWFANPAFVRTWCVLVDRLVCLRFEKQEVFAAVHRVSIFTIRKILGKHLAEDDIVFSICHLFIKYSVFVQDGYKTNDVTWGLIGHVAELLEKETNSDKNMKIIEDLCRFLFEFAQNSSCLWALTMSAQRYQKIRPLLTKLNEEYPENEKITVPCTMILKHLNKPSIVSLYWEKIPQHLCEAL
jgi:hypothetical protein